MKVGVAMDGLLVASQDVAHDPPTLRQHGVTHILNVSYGIANRFPEVLPIIYDCTVLVFHFCLLHPCFVTQFSFSNVKSLEYHIYCQILNVSSFII